MMILEKITRLADEREYLLALEFLYDEIKAVSSEKDCEEKALKLVELSFGEVMLKNDFKETFSKFILNTFNTHCEWCFWCYYMVSNAIEERDLKSLDQICEDDIKKFRDTFEKREKQSVGTCYENGRVFIFSFDYRIINVTVFDFTLNDSFDMLIDLSDFELSLSVFAKRMDAYYSERYLDVKIDKVVGMINTLYQKYPVKALL